MADTISFVNGSTVALIGTSQPNGRSLRSAIMFPATPKSERKPYVGIDLDETLNNLIRCLLIAYNEKYDDNVAFTDITSYNIQPFLKPECANVFKEFCTDDFIRSLYCDPRDIEAINLLRNRAETLFVTAAYPYTVLARHQWLEGLFPWYDPSRLVICRKKSLLKLDYLIDDCADNFTDFDGKGVLITKPWNVDVPTFSTSMWHDTKDTTILLRQTSVASAVSRILNDIVLRQE